MKTMKFLKLCLFLALPIKTFFSVAQIFHLSQTRFYYHCAVAHKMGRQYIGIEQMDYIEDIAVKRMQKVIGKTVKKDKNTF
jgi:hypothetical protein